LRHYSNWSGLDVNIDVPHIFDVLCPEKERGREHKDYLVWERETIETVHHLASELQELHTAQLAQLIADAEKEATVAEITYPRMTPQFVRALASNVEHPDLLMAELQKAGVSTDLLLPLLERVVKLGLPSNEVLLEQMILEPATSWIAIQCALTGGVSWKVKELAISQMTPSFKNLIEILSSEERSTSRRSISCLRHQIRSSAAMQRSLLAMLDPRCRPRICRRNCGPDGGK
jgi:hypothetical protein